MSNIIPLKPGDEIRVIAPSYRQPSRKKQRHSERAKERLESLGFVVSFGKYLKSEYHLGTARAGDRVSDYHEALTDKKVKAILAYSGGWSANEMLPLIDWNLAKSNPKPIIGYSDITVLLNAIYAKTGQIGYLGPNFSTFGRMISWKYTLENFDAAVRQQYPLKLTRSQEWGEKSSTRHKTTPWKVLQPGNAEGILLGGNLGTFYLLQGTEYQPKFDQPFILLAEDDDEGGKFSSREFSRRLESILQLPNVRKNLQGVAIGRFQPGSKMSLPLLGNIIASKKLGSIPVIANVDFGHTAPLLSLPIGGKAALKAEKGRIGFTLKRN